jgi:hypothetical protein
MYSAGFGGGCVDTFCCAATVDVADFDSVTCAQHTDRVRMAIPIAVTLDLGSIVRMRSSRALAGWSSPP